MVHGGVVHAGGISEHGKGGIEARMIPGIGNWLGYTSLDSLSTFAVMDLGVGS